MKIDVYDSFATTEKGVLMHFDVFVLAGATKEQALDYGRQWLQSIGEPPTSLEQSRCNFCHSELANPNVAKAIESQGFYILKMEGCPKAP